MVTVDYALSILQKLYDASVDAGGDSTSDPDGLSPLAAALKAAFKSGVSQDQSGRFVISTSGNGRSVTFESGVSAVEMGGLLYRMRKAFDIAQADLIAAGVSDPTDAQIFAEIEANPMALVSRPGAMTELQNDYSLLRCGLPEVTA